VSTAGILGMLPGEKALVVEVIINVLIALLMNIHGLQDVPY
jgi:hypothetical protein